MLSRKFYSSGALAMVAAMVAGFALAQDAPVPAKGKNPVTGQAPAATAAPATQTYRAKQILGSKVALQGNTAAGTVDDIVLDDHGNVDYLIVANADGQLVTVPWDAAVFNAEKQTATIQITPEQFKQVPTYTPQQYPVYSTPAYRVQTYKYYGLTPGQNRRLIRQGAIVTP